MTEGTAESSAGLDARLGESGCGPARAEAMDLAYPVILRWRGAALLVADVMAVLAAFLFAYCLRFGLGFVGWSGPGADIVAYLRGALLLAVAWVFFIWQDSGYESGLRGVASPVVRGRSVLVAGFKAMAALLAISFLYRGLPMSRSVYLMTGAMGMAGMLLLRVLWRELDRDLARHGLGIRQIVVAGADPQALDFAERLEKIGGSVRITGFIADRAHASSNGKAGPLLGHLDDIEAVYERCRFDDLVLSAAALDATEVQSRAKVIELVNFCEARGIGLYTLPNVFSVAVERRDVASLSGVPLVMMRDAALHPAYGIVKRAMDVAIAATLLVVGLPLWLLIALCIRLTSDGPVFFTQVRAGLHGRPFKMYKFRSMVVDAEARLKDLVDFDKLKVPGFKLKNDPRVTPVGRILRRTSLDEIPQLLNVLKGEMSLVGPRPELPDLVARYDAWQRRRLKAKPGMTGYQQVMARGQPLAAVLEYDLIYIKHQSLLLDLYIMFRTVYVVIRGSGITH